MRTAPTLGIAILLAAVSPAVGFARQATAASDSTPAAASLDPRQGQEIGSVFEAFLSPDQEPGEEKDTPAATPKQFKSTAPSQLRSERQGRGHGVLRFTRDLSKVYVEVRVEGIDPKDVNMFHIHCGRPDMLGPILVDFALAGDLQKNLADGVFSVELTNADIEKTEQSGQGATGAFLIGCPIVPGLRDKAKTISGMESIARQGELYFNLHTYGQTYYGNIRGKLKPQAPVAQ